jgi:hypothetical protein
MKISGNDPVLEPSTFSQRMLRAWDRFWFTPADPTTLGLIRVCCGLITLYTILVYSFDLQDFMGRHAWYDLHSRLSNVRNRAIQITTLSGQENPHRPPRNADEEAHAKEYLRQLGFLPPPPYPKNEEEAKYIFTYYARFGFDLRTYGLPPPSTDFEKNYLIEYTVKFRIPPPPPYPKNIEHARSIEEYIETHGGDPRRLYARGQPIWSIWFHVTEPTAMVVVHSCIILVTFLFTIGFATRITSWLTWFGALSYIHRSWVVLFGVDTMMTILLLYLAIGPSGAALSVDRLIARWWSRAKPGAIGKWRAWWRKDPAPETIAPARYSPAPEPSIAANFVIRLLQIHVCIIYLAAGLSKLQGDAWWQGTALWATLANYEFAPMQYPLYVGFLRWLGQDQFRFEFFLTCGALFTLIFEIGYAFLVWRPLTRWIFLAMAVTLHGFIGIFMGLKTFSLMMLVMNMAFVRPSEVRWVLGLFGGGRPPASAPPARAEEAVPTVKPTAIRAALEPAGPISRSHIKRKK